MRKVQTVGSIGDFMKNELKAVMPEESAKMKVIRFLDENQSIIYGGVGLSLVLVFGIDGTVFASTGIDKAANGIYDKLLNVGKWVIVIKGGIETIKSVSSSDLQGAQKNFLQYLLIYGLLWALPWAMTEVEKMFIDMRGY